MGDFNQSYRGFSPELEVKQLVVNAEETFRQAQVAEKIAEPDVYRERIGSAALGDTANNLRYVSDKWADTASNLQEQAELEHERQAVRYTVAAGQRIIALRTQLAA